MNKRIKELDIEKILFFDIETVRRNKVIDVDSKEFELYSWSLRDKTTGFIPPSIEVSKHYEKNGALKPEFNKIVVISIGFISNGVLYYKALVGEQATMIKEFYSIVESTGFKLCGHNVIGFDVPTIRIKAFEEDITNIPVGANDSGKKPWDMEKDIIDTMKLITGSYFYNISLDSACMMKNIKSSKDDISGAYVSEVYYREGVERIANYCNKDVIATAELFCALAGKSGVIKSYVDRGGKVLKEKEEVNVLDHILSSGNLCSKVLESLSNFADESGEPRENILTLALAALSKTKEYQKVPEEDVETLKEALGLTVDYSLISCVVERKNLQKKQANELISLYKNEKEEIKKEVVDLVEKFLKEFNKINQKTAKESLLFLKTKLLNNK